MRHRGQGVVADLGRLAAATGGTGRIEDLGPVRMGAAIETCEASIVSKSRSPWDR